MIVCRQMDAMRRRRGPIVMAAGVFDGVHRGHARVAARCRARADAHGGRAWMLTFDPHPAQRLRPDAAPRLLTTLPHKLALLAAHGIDGCLILAFTPALAALSPETFVAMLCDGMPALRTMVVGRNWRFGADGAGDVARLRRLLRRRGAAVETVAPCRYAGQWISSTRIREAVSAGRLDEAAHMLGRPFEIVGTVVRGHGVGRQLGFPTANLDPHNEVLPPEGVYAVWVRVGRRRLGGMLCRGRRPTVQAGPAAAPVVEVHVFDVDTDFYGRDLTVAFAAYLRPEIRFPSTAALRQQLSRDARDARDALRRAKRRCAPPNGSDKKRFTVPGRLRIVPPNH